MAEVLKRTSYHPIFNEVLDFSTALLDGEGRLIASSMGVTVHLGALELSAKAIIDRFGKENLGPGDVLIHNNPFPGGTHLPDVDVITPVYHEGRTGRLRRVPGPPRRHRGHAPGQLRRRHRQHLPGGGAHPAHQALRGRASSTRECAISSWPTCGCRSSPGATCRPRWPAAGWGRGASGSCSTSTAPQR